VSSSGTDLLRARGLGPKKSFGQNFLQQPEIAARIAELATTPSGGSVLEIGAGLGALTEPLLARCGRLVAVERDRDLIPLLAERFDGHSLLELLEADAVKLDWEALLREGPPPRTIVGNLPYQLSGRLLRRAIEHAAWVDRVVFMVQREVADRLVAPAGSRAYGALSVFTQAAFEPKCVLRVRAGAFSPKPKVDSTVVVLTPRRPPRAVEDDRFRAVVRAGFAQRRKKLRNCWRSLAEWSAEQLQREADEAEVDLDLRAERLEVEDFARMAARLPS